MLSHMSYLLAMRRTSPPSKAADGEGERDDERSVRAEHRLGGVRSAPLRYLLIGVAAPVVDTAATLLFAVPVGLMHLAVRRRSALARRKLAGYLLHCALLYGLLGALLALGGVRSVAYLFASRLFFCGWLGHPLLAFWCTVHQSRATVRVGRRRRSLRRAA